MPAIKFKCPEKGCRVTTEIWVPNYPQHQTEHDADAACNKHKKKFSEIRRKHIAICKRIGIRP